MAVGRLPRAHTGAMPQTEPSTESSPLRPDPARPRVDVVGAAIVDDLDRPRALLCARRVEPEHLAGSWELPGGKVEPGETWEQALHREIAEELGVRIRLGECVRGPLPDGRWQLSPRHVIAVWLAEIVDGEPRPLDEHDALRWLPRQRVGEVAWLEGDRPIIEAIVADW